MKKQITLILALIIGLASGLTAAPLFGPKGKFSTTFLVLEYDPSSACTKPYKPFGNDQWALDRYKRDAVEFVDCMENAAKADAQYAAEVVAEGFEEALDEFVAELRRGY